MKRKKYNIHSDFKKLSKTNPPINSFMARVIQFFTKSLINKEKSDENCLVEQKMFETNNIKIKYLIYTPKGSEECELPCLIYYHGGGYILPTAPYHLKYAREYAAQCGCKVFVPDYPLAPKYRFPVQPNACFEFYRYLLANAKELKINSDKIVVSGDSAGGSLASIVSMLASDCGEKLPLAQMLIYPVVGIEPPTKSMLEFDDTGMCNSRDFKKYCKLYFKNESDMQSRYASSLSQENLSNYPSTYIETAEFDCLRDEAIIFAEKLKGSGVNVSEHRTKGTIHAYDMVTDSEISKESVAKRIEFLNKMFNAE